MKIINTYPRFKPLFFSQHGLVLAKRDQVFLLQSDNQLRLLFTLPNRRINRLFDHFPLLFRLRRAGIYAATAWGDQFIFAHDGGLFHYDYQSSQLFEHKRFERGRGPLQFAVLENVPGFIDGVCYGEYFENPTLNVAHIYQLTGKDQWRIVHTFDKGRINHIHALIPDPTAECVWILTGDVDEGASICRATDNFDQVEVVVKGQQSFRACVAFPRAEGLLYATDTQLESNSIRLLYNNDGQWTSKALMAINGSAIYGCELKDYYVFSTATEPGEEKPNRILNLVDCQPGPGIVKNVSDIIICDKKTLSCQVIKSVGKDRYPYRLFQFGSFMFPNGHNNSNRLYAYSVANRENDLGTEVLDIDAPLPVEASIEMEALE